MLSGGNHTLEPATTYRGYRTDLPISYASGGDGGKSSWDYGRRTHSKT